MDNSLNQGQVDGINFLLDNFEQYDEYWNDVRQIAYAFATVYHETAYSFQPVAEGYYLGNSKKPNYYQGNTERVFRFQRSLRYYPDFGRGYVQLTWDYNYKDQDKKIRQHLPEVVEDFERETGQTFSLIKHPEQAFHPKIAFAIMTIGMHFGTFRPGHTLDKYISGNKKDYVWARYIINGKRKGAKFPDKAQEIAAYAEKFESILRSSLVKENEEVKEHHSEIPHEGEEVPTGTEDHQIEEQTGEEITNIEPEQIDQQAGQITNIDNSEKTVPDNFTPEDKDITAPAPSNVLSKGWKWLLGLGIIPTTGGGIIEGIKGFTSTGFNWANVFEVSKQVLLFLLPYLFWIALAFIVLWGLKELFKQISFIVNQYTLARGDMNNVTVIPAKQEIKTESRFNLFS